CSIPLLLDRTISVCLSLSRASAHHVLHSFPTRRSSDLNVLTLHAEVEGGPLRPALERFVEGARRAGAALTRLDEVAAAALADGDDLPVAPVIRGRVDGRSGWISAPGPAVRPGVGASQ